MYSICDRKGTAKERLSLYFFWERRSALRLLTCFASADVKVRHAPGDNDGCKVGPHRKEPEGKMAEGSEGEETMEAWSGCLFGSVESQKVLPSSVLHPTIFPQPQLGATYPLVLLLFAASALPQLLYPLSVRLTRNPPIKFI